MKVPLEAADKQGTTAVARTWKRQVGLSDSSLFTDVEPAEATQSTNIRSRSANFTIIFA
jgi:hypothetical protein